MGRILRGLIYLTILAGIGLVAFAYLGDMTPPQETVSQPVVLNVD